MIPLKNELTFEKFEVKYKSNLENVCTVPIDFKMTKLSSIKFLGNL